MSEQNQPPKRNGLAPSAAIITLASTAVILAVTLVWNFVDGVKDDLAAHALLDHHAAMGEQMAGVQQRLGEQDLKTGDRFTRSDWLASKEWVLAVLEHINDRLDKLEARHSQDYRYPKDMQQ